VTKSTLVRLIAAAAVLAGTAAAFAATPVEVYVPGLGHFIPAEKAAPVRHALGDPDAPGETKAAAPVPDGAPDALPGHLVGPDVPVPVSPVVLVPSNGWIAAHGRTLVAVYAGEAGDGSGAGRFVIVRQDRLGGTQGQQIVDVARSGPLSIVGAEAGRALGFRTRSGRAGELDLEHGIATLAP
jgi:hypothetical protein